MAAAAAMFLQGCFGAGGGSSASPPNNVVVEAKDSRVVVTWDMVPNVQYWVWKVAGTVGITPQTCSSMPLCTTAINVSSPATISGLVNGQPYSFTINGRINGGPGGQGSPAVSATPRMAGATWSTGTALGINSFRGVAYGAMFVTVGDGGASYSSTDGKTWTALTSGTPQTLNAVNYDNAHSKYLGVGAAGTLIALTPATSATNWSLLTTSPTPNALYALANNTTGFTVATGANGTIITSGDGATWADNTATSGTTRNLYGVAFGYDSTNARNVFVAVGAAGTVIYSADGVNWTAATSVTPNDLKSVSYGLAAGVFVAVGANGTVLTSPNGITWTAQPAASTTIPATTLLNSVTFSVGRRFVAVANDGKIFYSEYGSAGTIWTQVTPQPTLSPLYAITTGGLFDYSAVGSAGQNLYSD